jgi:hypothetical protein
MAQPKRPSRAPSASPRAEKRALSGERPRVIADSPAARLDGIIERVVAVANDLSALGTEEARLGADVLRTVVAALDRAPGDATSVRALAAARDALSQAWAPSLKWWHRRFARLAGEPAGTSPGDDVGL